MPLLMLECRSCHKIFSSGINMSPGASATLIDNKSKCPFCGSLENIPNGTFMATVNGFIDILKDSKNPLREAKEILNGLKKKDISGIPGKGKVEKILENNRLKIAMTIAILKVIIDLLTNKPDIQINNILIDQKFFTEYNQSIEIYCQPEDGSTPRGTDGQTAI